MVERPVEIIFEILEEPKGGYSASALEGGIFTQAETLEALKSAVRDAVRCHLDEGQATGIVRFP